MNRKLLGGLGAVTLATALAVAFVPIVRNNVASAISRNYVATSADYTTDFNGYAYVDGESIYLHYTDKKLESTTINNSLFEINFTSATTVTLKQGDYYFGYGTSGTDITKMTENPYEWNVHDGALYIQDNTRLLMYQAGTVNTGKVYAVSNIGKENYYPIVFYTRDQYTEAYNHCHWGDGSTRQQALYNLSYELPEPPVKYTVSFNAGEGSGTMNSQDVVEGHSIQQPECTFEAPTGKTFDKWYIGENEVSFPYTVTDNITFTAHWKEKSPETNTYTLDGTTTGGTNGYATESDISQNDIDWKVTGNTTMSPWRIGGKSLSGVDRKIYSTGTIGGTVTSIELEVGAASSITVNSLKLIAASNADFSNVIEEITKTFAANSTITFTPTKTLTQCYYKIVFNVSVSGTSNKFVEFKSLTFTYE